jgi:hypothetical protein
MNKIHNLIAEGKKLHKKHDALREEVLSPPNFSAEFKNKFKDMVEFTMSLINKTKYEKYEK